MKEAPKRAMLPESPSNFYSGSPQLPANFFTTWNHKIQINSFLYHKFSSSQNYYYSKDINNIIANGRNSKVIKFHETDAFDFREEFCQRAYTCNEAKEKLKGLAEYYKFHVDVPRIFMLPTAHIVHRFHDKMRRLNYMKITKMIEGFEPEDVKLHDTDSGFYNHKISKCSEHPSLQNLIPLDLKKSFTRYSNKPKSSIRKKVQAKEANSTFTIKELNVVLESLFKNNKNSTRTFKKNIEPIILAISDKKMLERNKSSLNRKKLNSERIAIEEPTKAQIKSFKCPSSKQLMDRSPLKTAISRNYQSKTKIFESLGSNQRISEKQSYPKRKPTTSKDAKPREAISQKVIKTSRMSGKIQNLNINNLNINFNFNNLSKNNEQNVRPTCLSRDLKMPSIETYNSKLDPLLSTLQINSPRFSLLKRFQSSQEFGNKVIIFPSQSPKERNSSISKRIDADHRSLEKTQIKRGNNHNMTESSNDKKVINLKGIFMKTSIENIDENSGYMKNFGTFGQLKDHFNNKYVRNAHLVKGISSEKPIYSFENDLSIKNLQKISSKTMTKERGNTNKRNSINNQTNNKKNYPDSIGPVSKHLNNFSQELTSSRGIAKQGNAFVSKEVRKASSEISKQRLAQSNIAMLHSNIQKNVRPIKLQRSGSIYNMTEDSNKVLNLQKLGTVKSSSRSMKGKTNLYHNSHTTNVMTHLPVSLNQLENKFLRRSKLQKNKTEDDKSQPTNRFHKKLFLDSELWDK
jgi:hypothetical protein